ncbi:MAG: hypothetical protein ACYSSO_12965 [Planctomycetota bacterium]|jgi:hypothetical protein
MTQQKLCQDCSQNHDCKELYDQLGHAKGPSIALKAVIAFLLPLAVFIGALAVFETFSNRTLNEGHLHVLLDFLLAISATLTVIISINVINRKLGKAK